MHVINPSRVFPPAPVLHAHLHIRSVVSFSVEHIMADESGPRASTDDADSEHEQEVPTSQASSFSIEVHEAAASFEREEKCRR